LRQDLSKLAATPSRPPISFRMFGQADAPTCSNSEVEAQQAQLAVTMAEQNQQRVWKARAAVVGNPRLPLMKLEGKLEDTPRSMPTTGGENRQRESSRKIAGSVSNELKQPWLARSANRFPTCNSAVACSRMASCCPGLTEVCRTTGLCQLGQNSTFDRTRETLQPRRPM